MRLCAWTLAGLFLGGAAPAPPGPEAFRLQAPIEGSFTPDAPARVPLPREVIAATRSLEDLRIFDDQGRATPFAVREDRVAGEEAWRFPFEILSYSGEGGRTEVVARKPSEVSFHDEIEIQTEARDFKKAIRLQASGDGREWRDLAADLIFDFSSRLDLRKTAVAVPRTEAALLKVILEDAAEEAPPGPEVRLQYEGVDLSLAPGSGTPFRLEGISGRSTRRGPGRLVLERARLTPISTRIDAGRDSVIALGEVNLPIEEAILEIENAYYYRRVDLLAADEDEDAAYRIAASGNIYKFPGMRAAENGIRKKVEGARWLRLKVMNGENPPLRVAAVEVAWARKSLYFVPESGRRYALSFGSPAAPAPEYELGRLIPSEPADLAGYQVLTAGTIVENPLFDPRWGEPSRTASEELQDVAFTGVVLAVAAVLAAWLFVLARRVPGPREAGEGREADPTPR